VTKLAVVYIIDYFWESNPEYFLQSIMRRFYDMSKYIFYSGYSNYSCHITSIWPGTSKNPKSGEEYIPHSTDGHSRHRVWWNLGAKSIQQTCHLINQLETHF